MNKDRKVMYMGAFDDKITHPKTHYLPDATKAATGDAATMSPPIAGPMMVAI